MPTPTSTRWIDTLVQRVDRIRRAHNLCELQRTTYMFVAATLAGTTMLLVTALFGSTRLFAVTVWSSLAALMVTTILLAREARSRWLHRERAVAWIENRTPLGGRLRSLLELHARGTNAGTRFFLVLLRDENERALPSWEPHRVVPTRVPRVALALSLLSLSALLAALTLTPVLHPRTPELASTNAAAAAGTHARAEHTGELDPDDGQRSRLATIPANLQERIRQSVWGSAWDRAREAMLDAERSRQHAADRAPEDEPGSANDTEGPWQLADRTRPNTRPLNRSRSDADADDTQADARAPRRTLAQRDNAMDHDGGAGNGAGAGTGTSPELYGAAAPPDLASHARFELGLVTRMRLQHREGQPGNSSPPRAPDQRPIMTISDRGEELGHEMAIPRAYEPIVRQVFAHRSAEGLE